MPDPEPPVPTPPERSFRRWAETAEAVRATRRTSEKVRLVAGYLRLLDPADVPPAVLFFSGRPFAERDERTAGLGWAAISAVAQSVAGTADGTLRAAYDRSSDLGTAVGELLAEVGHAPAEGESLSLGDVAAAYAALAAARGREPKAAVFADLLRRGDPLGARYVTAILSGELRIGLREGHLEAAVAEAFDVPAADIGWAGMLTGDLGLTAGLARDGRLGEARLALFHPLKSMLASPVIDEAEALSRLSPPIWVEDKYDGIRAQLHRESDRVRLYTRDLNDVSGQFPEVVRAAASLPWDGILDGEILAWRDGAALPFLQLQARLGRKAPTLDIQAAVPVIFVAFDVLALRLPAAPVGPTMTASPVAGASPAADPGREEQAIEPLLRMPLHQRRRQLESLGLDRTPGFGLAMLGRVADETELRAVFSAAQARGNEGLMLKDPDSPYTPGRRGYAWLKLKKALTTLDCVVVGVEVGHGRRHGVLSDYTFAVIDDRPGAPAGALVTIGKAYSGLTDAEIAEMTGWFEAHTLSRHGRYRVVEPLVVVEIAFDVVHRSARHASGYALRFPRIVRIRDDKPPADADRLSSVARLHDRLQAVGRAGVLTIGEGRAVGEGGGLGDRPPQDHDRGDVPATGIPHAR